MVRKKNNLFSILIVIVILLITVSTGYKLYENHSNKLYIVVKKEIEEAAVKCIIDEECENEVSLNTLIEKKYIGDVVNPKTKEYISGSTKIKCDKYICNVNF